MSILLSVSSWAYLLVAPPFERTLRSQKPSIQILDLPIIFKDENVILRILVIKPQILLLSGFVVELLYSGCYSHNTKIDLILRIIGTLRPLKPYLELFSPKMTSGPTLVPVPKELGLDMTAAWSNVIAWAIDHAHLSAQLCLVPDFRNRQLYL